jgi:adenylate kinase
MVSEKRGTPQISTGDILREAVARGTELGTKAKGYMDSGKLVPDDIMLPLVEKRIGESDCSKGFILDGFPRTLDQAMGLEEILAGGDCPLDLVLFIDVPDEVVAERLSLRRVCPQCKALYNLKADPPRTHGVCDRCNVELAPRIDDEGKTVKTRLRVYRDNTLPLVEFYEAQGILHRIDGSGEIDEVLRSIVAEIEAVEGS